MDSPTLDTSPGKAGASLASIPSAPRKSSKLVTSLRKSPLKPSDTPSSKSKPMTPSTLCKPRKQEESLLDGIAYEVSTSRGIFKPNLSDSESDEVPESGTPQKSIRNFGRVRTSSPIKLSSPENGLFGSQRSPAKTPVGSSKQPPNVDLFGLTPTASHISPAKTTSSHYTIVPSSPVDGPASSRRSSKLIVPVTLSPSGVAHSARPIQHFLAQSSVAPTLLPPQTVGSPPRTTIDALSSSKLVLPPIPPESSTKPRLALDQKAAKSPFQFTCDLSPRCEIPEEVWTLGTLAIQLDSRGGLRLCLDLIDSEGVNILKNRQKFTEGARAGPLGTLTFLPPKVRDRIYSHVFGVTDVPSTEAMFQVSPKLKSRYKKGKYRNNITVTLYPHPNLAPLRHFETLFGEAADVVLNIFEKGEGKWDDPAMKGPKPIYNPVFHMALTEGSKKRPYYDTHLSVQGLKNFPFEQFQTVRLIAQRTRSIEHRVAIGDWIYKSNCVLPPKLTQVLPAINVFSDGFVIQLSITPPQISEAFHKIYERDAPYDCFLGTAVSDQMKSSSSPKAHTHLAGADCNILKIFGRYITYTTDEAPTITPNLHKKPEKLRVIDAYVYPRLSPGCSMVKRNNPELQRVLERFEPLEENSEAWFLLKPEPSRFHVSHADTFAYRDDGLEYE